MAGRGGFSLLDVFGLEQLLASGHVGHAEQLAGADKSHEHVACPPDEGRHGLVERAPENGVGRKAEPGAVAGQQQAHGFFEAAAGGLGGQGHGLRRGLHLARFHQHRVAARAKLQKHGEYLAGAGGVGRVGGRRQGPGLIAPRRVSAKHAVFGAAGQTFKRATWGLRPHGLASGQ